MNAGLSPQTTTPAELEVLRQRITELEANETMHVQTAAALRKEAERTLAWEVQVNTSLAAMSRALLDSASLDEMSALVLKYGKELTGSEYGFVGYIDPDTGFFINTTLTRDIWDVCLVADKCCPTS